MKNRILGKKADDQIAGFTSNRRNLVQQIAITVFFTALSVSGIIAWIYASYFKGDYASLLVFFGQDGNCETATQGLGVHCFGDYSAIHFTNLWDPPVGAEIVYPVINRLFRLPFLLIENLTTYRVGLYLYLFALYVAVIFPVAHYCLNTKNKKFRISLIFLATTNLGLISTLDRGNVIGFAVPCLYLFLLNFQKNSYSKAGWWLMLASAVKPQIALFAIAFIWAAEYRIFFYSIIRVIALLTIPYSIFGLKSFVYFQNWLEETRRWSNSLLPVADFPANYSFNKIVAIFGSDFSAFSFLLGIFLVVLISAPYLRKGRGSRVSSIDLVQLGLIVTCMNSIVYVYYTVLLVPLLMVLFEADTEEVGAGDGENRRKVLLASVIAFAIAPLAFPSRWILSDSAGGEGAYNQVPLVVVLLIFSYFLSSTVSMIRVHYWRNKSASKVFI